SAPQQHADGAVETRELIQLQPLADCGQLPQQVLDARLDLRLAQGVRAADQQADERAHDQRAVALDHLSPGEQDLGEYRQVDAALFVDAGKARNDVDQEEQAYQAADREKQRRIDRRVDQALADRLELVLVGDIAHERGREIARLLARLNGGDVQGWEGLGKLLHRR